MIPDRSGIRQRKDLSLCISWKGDATVFSSQNEEQSPKKHRQIGNHTCVQKHILAHTEWDFVFTSGLLQICTTVITVDNYLFRVVACEVNNNLLIFFFIRYHEHLMLDEFFWIIFV